MERFKSLIVSETENHCAIGEEIGKKNIADGNVPVFSCEGACIRGEIARRAANLIARKPGFGRACHGEVLTVPDSAIARWVDGAAKTILIDGCFLRCHGRMMENLINKGRLVQYDALSVYKKYSDIFDPDDVPQEEINIAAEEVAQSVMKTFGSGKQPCNESAGCEVKTSGCCEEEVLIEKKI